jgi:diguanylate cyclase (GGDEF)-like protein
MLPITLKGLAAARSPKAWAGPVVAHSNRATDTVRSLWIVRWLTVLCAVVMLGMLGLGSWVLLEGRRDTWMQAEEATTNLVMALERDVARNIALYDLSLQGAMDAFAEPGLAQLSPTFRRMSLFDRAASAEYVGSLNVLDPMGNIADSSKDIIKPGINLADRDYFQVHSRHNDSGLFVSRPFFSRLRDNDPSIAISRRLAGPDGRFLGVVAGTLRLAYFQDLFDKLNLGTDGSITLVRSDGILLARRPMALTRIGQDFSQTPVFKASLSGPFGSFVGKRSIDSTDCLIIYRHVGDLPLILIMARSVSDIYATWWHKAYAIGSMLLLLGVATMMLCVLFRREMYRRVQAEQTLIKVAEQLRQAADTDPLTNLHNRRAFSRNLSREWGRAIRDETSIALVMLDADCFKLYNDHYGHQKGDAVLVAIAGCIQHALRRPADMGARYGGEEFVVIMPGADLQGVAVVGEAIRAAIAALNIPHARNTDGRATVSVGVAAMIPQHGRPEDSLIRAADSALYEAKHQGRNRVCVAAPGGPTDMPCDAAASAPAPAASRVVMLRPYNAA